MKASTRTYPFLAAAVGLTLAIGACNTTEGVGEDIESLGEGVEDTAEDVDDEL